MMKSYNYFSHLFKQQHNIPPKQQQDIPSALFEVFDGTKKFPKKQPENITHGAMPNVVDDGNTQ
jgi:hypothetical protein